MYHLFNVENEGILVFWDEIGFEPKLKGRLLLVWAKILNPSGMIVDLIVNPIMRGMCFYGLP